MEEVKYVCALSPRQRIKEPAIALKSSQHKHITQSIGQMSFDYASISLYTCMYMHMILASQVFDTLVWMASKNDEMLLLANSFAIK